MEISIKEIQQYELSILCYFDKVCRENEIKYSLAYGTLLGAVRHKGFIPWDDDIDIAMTRENYNKLLSVWQNNNDGRYKLCSIHNEPKWTAALPKIIDTYTVLNQTGHREKMDLGVYMDVFIMDRVPKGIVTKWLWQSELDFLHKLWGLCEHENRSVSDGKTWKNTTKDWLSNIVVHFISARDVAMWIDNTSKKFEKTANFDFVVPGIFGGDKWCSVEVPNHIMMAVSDLPFERQFFPCYTDFHTILSTIYGDYMQLPPKEKRVSHHSYTLSLRSDMKDSRNES